MLDDGAGKLARGHQPLQKGARGDIEGARSIWMRHLDGTPSQVIFAERCKRGLCTGPACALEVTYDTLVSNTVKISSSL